MSERLRIAVCDDESRALAIVSSAVEGILSDMGIELILEKFLGPVELLERLNPALECISVTETGAVLIDVKVERSATNPLMIYQSVPAVVDGFLCAALWIHGERVGQAIFTLPWDGVNYSTTLHGICRFPMKKSDRYDVTFEPYNLWAIEKIK